MSTNPRISVADTLLDDASLGRVQADTAFTHAEKIGVWMIRAGRAILADCRAGKTGTDEVMVALHELRRLRPTVQGRRSDLTDQVTAGSPVAA